MVMAWDGYNNESHEKSGYDKSWSGYNTESHRKQLVKSWGGYFTESHVKQFGTLEVGIPVSPTGSELQGLRWVLHWVPREALIDLRWVLHWVPREVVGEHLRWVLHWVPREVMCFVHVWFVKFLMERYLRLEMGVIPSPMRNKGGSS